MSGSKYKNLKELKCTEWRTQWRVAYTFAPNRKGILLCGDSKSSMNQVLFYDTLIVTAKSDTPHLEGYN